jgi:hypothetical protein
MVVFNLIDFFSVWLSAHKIGIISIEIYIFGKFVELMPAKIPNYIVGTEVKAAFLRADSLRLGNLLTIRCLTANRRLNAHSGSFRVSNCNVRI